MTRSLTLSLLTLTSLSGLTMAHADSSVPAKDSVSHSATHIDRSEAAQTTFDEQKSKGDAPRPKPKPGPRDGDEE